MVMNGIKRRFNKHNITHRLAEHFVFRLNYNIIIIIPAEAFFIIFNPKDLFEILTKQLIKPKPVNYKFNFQPYGKERRNLSFSSKLIFKMN